MKSWLDADFRPNHGGKYIPAIGEAARLLNINRTCPCVLFFLSDGKPSDKGGDFVGNLGSLASTFGKRLAFNSIGFAVPCEEDFTVMKQLAEEAKQYVGRASEAVRTPGFSPVGATTRYFRIERFAIFSHGVGASVTVALCHDRRARHPFLSRYGRLKFAK